jgi:3-hydroxymyristoyl/3-hydroxydecanoyl-(acyl carrier protein) dehydratase
MDESAVVEFTIPTDHPVLQDHFKDHPIVPGALILDAVIRGLKDQGLRATKVPEIKFKATLSGGTPARIHYTPSTRGLRFRVDASGLEIATGILSIVRQ